MSKKALTVRLDVGLQTALAALSKTLRRPMNKLIIEAVSAYVDQHGREVERDLEACLANLRAHRKHDPDFKRAIAAFAKTEAEAGTKDPIEGQPVNSDNPLRKKKRKLLNA